jgi:aldehyde dehydrogenase (NAD+)
MTTLSPNVENFLNQQLIGHFIGGEFVQPAGQERIAVLDPATAKEITSVLKGDAATVDAAVQSAHQAFPAWSGLSVDERSDILARFADLLEKHQAELASIESLDVGKTITAAGEFDIPFGIDCIRYFEQFARSATYEMPLDVADLDASVIRQAYGACGFIFPWNFPFDLLMWGTIPALAAGNTVVVKASEVTPLSTLFTAKLAAEAGIPAGVINVVNGHGDVGAAITNHPLIRRMSFTGSPQVGSLVGEACGRRIIPCKLELGGKGAAVILEDADIPATAEALAGAITLNAGQVCCTASRWIVQDSVYDEFVSAVTAELKKVQIGPGLDPDSQMGPLVSAAQKERVESYYHKGKAEGAQVVIEPGKRSDDGFFVEPYLLSGDTDNVCFKEEIFGPTAYLTRAKDAEDAIEQVNSLAYGLANSVWTKDPELAKSVASRMVAGNSWINAHNVFAYGLPYGGYGLSGTGGGVNSGSTFYDYLREQTVARPL